MLTDPPKGSFLILVSGILNCLLGLVHQIILYFTYIDYSGNTGPATTELLSDFLLFSMAIGTAIFFTGGLTCYGYRGIRKGENWAVVICGGASLLLLTFAISVLAVFGFAHPIAYVHLLNSLLIVAPLMLMKRTKGKTINTASIAQMEG